MPNDSVNYRLQIELTPENNKYSWSIARDVYYAGDDATQHSVVAHGNADSIDNAYNDAKLAMNRLNINHQEY